MWPNRLRSAVSASSHPLGNGSVVQTSVHEVISKYLNLVWHVSRQGMAEIRDCA